MRRKDDNGTCDNVNARYFSLTLAGLLICTEKHNASAWEFHAGPIFDHFRLTLEPGERTELAGPLYYYEKKESQRIWAVPPLLSYTSDAATDFEEVDLGYPIITYDRYGGQYRLQIFQLLSFAGGPTQHESFRNRFTILPLYFQQRPPDSKQSYTASGPFHRHRHNQANLAAGVSARVQPLALVQP